MEHKTTLKIPDSTNEGSGSVSLTVKKVRVRPKYNNQGEIRKMKLLIDLNKDESVAFQTLADSIKPEGVSVDSFVKSMFIVGINHYLEKIQEASSNVSISQESEVEVITPNES